MKNVVFTARPLRGHRHPGGASFRQPEQRVVRIALQMQNRLCGNPHRRFVNFSSGDDLLSHDLNTAVSSAMKGLTSGFGMEPGVPPSLWPPGQMSLGLFRKAGRSFAACPYLFYSWGLVLSYLP